MKLDPLGKDPRDPVFPAEPAEMRPETAEIGVSCPSCGGGPVAQEKVSTVFWRGRDLAVVRDVPAAVCWSCHDQFFDDETVTRLDLMRAGNFRTQEAVERLDVPVYTFPPSSAGPKP